MPSVEARCTNQMLIRSHFFRSSVKIVLGRRIVVQPQEPHGKREATSTVSICKLFRDLKQKQRKTRKSCVVCEQPVDDEYFLSKTTCITFENE